MITMNDSTSEALQVVLRADNALDLFRIQAHELERRFRTQMGNEDKISLSEVEQETREMLELTNNAEAAGLLNPELRFLNRASAIEGMFHRRMVEGFYEEALRDIDFKMRAIEKREGLGELEYWPVGEGPEDHEELNRKYDLITDQKFEETMREFGLHDMADLYRNNREVYDANREKGRRMVMKDLSDREILESLQEQFEKEAESCARCGAFHAAAVMIGSAVESSLLNACLKHKEIALEAKKRLSKEKCPSTNNPKDWGLGHLANVADEAGWLPRFIVEDVEILSASSLIKKVQRLRNLVHPARHLSDKNVLDVKGSYDVARASYLLLRRLLNEIQTP